MLRNITLLTILLSLAACGGSPSLESRDVVVDTEYTGGPVSNMLVLSLQEDSLHDSRVVIERGFTQRLQSAGVDAIAGYTRFDSVDALLANPQSFEPQLEQMGITSVLFLDPIRLDTDYDPGEYAARRSAYRSLGYDDSASINLLAQMARESSSAKVVMNVGLWLPGDDGDLFNSTYDINAPGNYDIDAAREYAQAFGEEVYVDLKKHGFVK